MIWYSLTEGHIIKKAKILREIQTGYVSGGNFSFNV